MQIFVGSHNPVKINAVVGAASETWPDVRVQGFDVPSGVSSQPRSDKETKQGAINRAKTALFEGLQASEQAASADSAAHNVLGVGLEGGVFEDDDGQMWSTVWVAVVDNNDGVYCANGARFLVPEVVAEKIRTGQEMGPVISQVVNEDDVRKKQGMIGIITKGFVDRTEEYQGIAKLALGLWYGKDWLEPYDV